MPYVGNNGLVGMPMLLAFCSWLNNYSCVAAPILVSAKEKYNPTLLQNAKTYLSNAYQFTKSK